MNLYKFIYSSKINCQEPEIENIVKQAYYDNTKNDLTGLLVYTKTHFYQIIEGDRKVLSKIIAKLYHDKRYSDLDIITFSPSDMRFFKNWGMTSFNIEEADPNFRTYLLSKYSKFDEIFETPEDPSTAISFLLDIKYQHILKKD